MHMENMAGKFLVEIARHDMQETEVQDVMMTWRAISARP
jgi:hypothetical protein